MAEIPYGKIIRRTWDRANFRALTVTERLLLCYIWSGPQGETSPMIHQFSIAAAIETLDLDRDTFQTAWKSLEEAGWFEYDYAARVIFLPRHLEFDPPQGANNIRGMFNRARHLDTPLLNKFIQSLQPYAEEWNISLLEGLPTPSPRGYQPPPQGVTNPLRTPEPEPKPKPEPGGVPHPLQTTPSLTHSDLDRVWAAWADAYKRKANARGWPINRYRSKPIEQIKMMGLVADHGPEAVITVIKAFFETEDKWLEEHGGYSVPIFASQFDRFAQIAGTKGADIIGPDGVEFRRLYADYLATRPAGSIWIDADFLTYCRMGGATPELMEFIEAELERTDPVRKAVGHE